ncbi:Cytochrome P450 3A4 [Colletotrichum higginsianum]|uniref:Cytochrome P450 3A4 n=1 Tax=Colletotrichum higginsianum TaxID=80884 RepID=A0A4T0VC76_9PEZI|nr:Cytochrome P450 3A4 [Colletotrichum higginsianum]
MVNNIAAFKEVQQAKVYSFRKSQLAARMFSPITGHGLMFSEGEERKKQRTQLALEHFLKKSTLDVFVIGSIGCDLDSIFVPEAHFYEVYERIIRQPPSGHVITFIDGHVPLRSWLPLASNKRWLKDVALIRAMLLTCVENRRHEMMAEKKLGLEDKTDRHDILTFILEDCQFDATQTNWTDLELLEYMLNFIAGGHETTGSTTMWVAHVLATVPKVQDRLKQEVLGLCAGKPRDWNPTYEELEHLVSSVPLFGLRRAPAYMSVSLPCCSRQGPFQAASVTNRIRVVTSGLLFKGLSPADRYNQTKGGFRNLSENPRTSISCRSG